MTHHYGYVGAVLAALLFGISSTLNKIALRNVHPMIVAGSIYLTAGIVVMFLRFTPLKDKLLKKLEFKVKTQEFFSRRDFLILTFIVFFGSFLAPLSFMFGLNKTTAVNASLLLNTETLFTVLIALLVFKEKASGRSIIGILLILIGAAVISTENFKEVELSKGILGNILIILAGLSWAIDNNLSKLLSVKRDLLLVTSLKGLFGGSALLILASLIGIRFYIPLQSLPYVLTVGAFSIGFSIVLFLFALREIGAMKTGAIFSTSSLIGALFAFLILGESFTAIKAFFGILMLFGVYLLSLE
ncbi:MAG: DMT family transporter [Thermococcus sp.]|uniref:DMT family transporter n=1 Tax=Thermococcus litoralis TaxID=2265 RepID=A0A7C0Y724_THELI|nr:DMT family transporter [Thermococcus sp.]OYT33535.1 MAG: EamA family transporter [Archaeoglobales archaeon ex4484_92]RLF87387.1 MAG: EamA family transporter [Thermococci archaeon]HDD31845.1 DMT family transporter [Thermococcus litoralis]MCD6139651.1 DMT family transporter [Thermococcus sp.]MCD6144334.1 DMT family transporter [Thermococcus sp.]